MSAHEMDLMSFMYDWMLDDVPSQQSRPGLPVRSGANQRLRSKVGYGWVPTLESDHD